MEQTFIVKMTTPEGGVKWDAKDVKWAIEAAFPSTFEAGFFTFSVAEAQEESK